VKDDRSASYTYHENHRKIIFINILVSLLQSIVFIQHVTLRLFVSSITITSYETKLQLPSLLFSFL